MAFYKLLQNICHSVNKIIIPHVVPENQELIVPVVSNEVKNFVRALPRAPKAQVTAIPPIHLCSNFGGASNKTLVLDLDETLVHASLDPLDDTDFTEKVILYDGQRRDIYVRLRPHLHYFLHEASR